MGYSLQTVFDEGFVRFVVTNENSPATLASFLEGCIAICRRSGTRIALIEDRLSGKDVDLEGLFQIIGDACEGARDLVDLVCYVKTSPEHDPAMVRFAENIATNHRLNVRVCRSVDEALLYIAHARGS